MLLPAFHVTVCHTVATHRIISLQQPTEYSSTATKRCMNSVFRGCRRKQDMVRGWVRARGRWEVGSREGLEVGTAQSCQVLVDETLSLKWSTQAGFKPLSVLLAWTCSRTWRASVRPFLPPHCQLRGRGTPTGAWNRLRTENSVVLSWGPTA